MKLPRHISLTIEHQPHATDYQSVEQWLSDPLGSAVLGAPRRDEVTVEDRAEMIRTGEVWMIHWYPDTPVGFCCVWAATLERALELANEDEGDGEP